MIRLLLVRHADAGVRGTWPGDDLDRELSGLGRDQARRLAGTLPGLLDGDGDAVTVASSRAVRCLATVRPFADDAELSIVTEPLLLEGADASATLAWLEGHDAPLVACTHGDVLGGVVTILRARGVVEGPMTWPKAGTWSLVGSDGLITGARLEPPPQIR